MIRTVRAEGETEAGSRTVQAACQAGLHRWLHEQKGQAGEAISFLSSALPSAPGEPHAPLSFSPNMVRKTVKLMGPGASFTMASSSSFLTFIRPGDGEGRGGCKGPGGTRPGRSQRESCCLSRFYGSACRHLALSIH